MKLHRGREEILTISNSPGVKGLLGAGRRNWLRKPRSDPAGSSPPRQSWARTTARDGQRRSQSSRSRGIREQAAMTWVMELHGGRISLEYPPGGGHDTRPSRPTGLRLVPGLSTPAPRPLLPVDPEGRWQDRHRPALPGASRALPGLESQHASRLWAWPDRARSAGHQPEGCCQLAPPLTASSCLPAISLCSTSPLRLQGRLQPWRRTRTLGPCGGLFRHALCLFDSAFDRL